MQELSITSVVVFKAKKDGTPYVGKFGNYYILDFTCDQYPEHLKAFISTDSDYQNLKVGDKVFAEVDPPKEFNGKFSRMARFAKPADVKVEKMAAALKKLITWAETQGFKL